MSPMPAKRPRIAEPMPDDRFDQSDQPASAIRRMPRRWESGGGGMVGTIGDYARFAQMLLNGGTLKAGATSSPRPSR